MAQVNPLTREVLIKLVYYGPGLGGKTTTLQKVHAASPAETRGKIVSLATPVDRTLYFDFMPLRVGPVQGFPVRLQLFTVPGQVYFNATRKLVLTGADGVVFVADSQRERQDANVESLQNLESNLNEQSRSLAQVPHVLQFNKRDLPNVLAFDELNAALNAHGARAFESAAARGQGVLEPLDELVRLVLADLDKRAVFRVEADKPEPQSPRFEAAQDGLGESISRASEELWRRDNLDHSTPSVKTLPPQTRTNPPPTRSSPPRGGLASVMPTRIPTAIHSGRKQVSEPARVPRFEANRDAAKVPTSGPSWAAVFPADQTPQVAQLEQDLVRGDFRSAMLRCDSLVAEILADAAEESGLEPDEKKPAIVAMCLGLSGERWRVFRALVQEARLGAEVSEAQALDTYTIVLELNRLRARSIPPRER